MALAQKCIEISKDWLFIPIVQQYAAIAQQVLDAWVQA